MNKASATQHRIRWFVYSGGEQLRHTAAMRGPWPGWDAECSCGWGSHTGGATRGSVRHEVWYHKWQAANGADEEK